MILLDDLLAAAGGRIHGPVAATLFDAFCFDSRLVRPGQLFLAAKTERADGHDYIQHACRGGAAGVLCQQPVDVSAFRATCIVVPDTRQAIQEWARYVLARQGVEIIGVTGSVGKTTAKEAIAAVLDTPGCPVFRNRANYNGLYGLSIALGELRPEHRVAVLEMAADHFGEIARLARIAPPRVAVVTTVEPAHLEAFGSLEAIGREKGDLVAALPPDGLAVLNADDPRVLAMAARTSARVVTFGACHKSDSDICATDILAAREGVSFTARTPAGSRKVNIPLLGRHQVYAALAALAVGLAQERDLDAIVARLAALPRVPGRLNPLPGHRGSLLLDDSYSSSPAAAEAALETVAALDARHRIAVLGDMLELGDYESAGHERVGQRAASVLDLLVTKGARARTIADAARSAGLGADQVVVTYTAEDAAHAVLERLAPGDVVLVKGSLATRMEQVVRLLMEEPRLAPDLLVRQDTAWQQIVTVSPDRPTWLEIDLAAIAHNVRRLKALAGRAQLMISLKADAYGHGAVQVAQTALLNGATWLGVACLSEGAALRQAGIVAPILILGYTPAWQARELLRHDLTATVFDLDVARALSRAALALERTARVHLKIDTGMGRLGIFPREALDLVEELRRLPALVVEGLFTHFSVADGATEWELNYTAGQAATFDRVLAELTAAGIEIPLIHAENSAALLRGRMSESANGRMSESANGRIGEWAKQRISESANQLPVSKIQPFDALRAGPPTSNLQHPTSNLQPPTPDLQPPTSNPSTRSGQALQPPTSSLQPPASNLQLIRTGIAVYGLDPSPQVRCPADFRVALAWKTQVAQVKALPAGSYVGYGAAYRTAGVERIAVIPVGYADGFRRAPQHWGEVLVRGRRAPIVGRVCMDQTMIDVTAIPGVRQGDEVVLIGRQGDDRITAEEVAARLGTINYEVVSAILARVPRETPA